MVLPGEAVDPKRKRETQPDRPSKSSIGRHLSDLLAQEEAAAGFLQAAQRPVPPVSENQAPSDGSSPAPDEAVLYNAFMPLEGNDQSGANEREPINRADYYRSLTYQERVLREEANWKAIIPAMFLSFMPCSRTTFEWVDPVLWNHDMNERCNCALWQRKVLTIDTVDFSGRAKILLETCTCTSDLVHLLRRGYIGGSPSRPTMAFSIRLLRFHHILWKYCTMRLEPFVEAVEEYLDPRSPLVLVSGSDQTRDWRKGFSAAVDVYREMLRLREQLANKALKLSPEDILASTCPACFGPEVPGKRPSEPNVIVCLDANFQQRRHTSASAAWRGESNIMPSLFLSPGEVKSWEIKMKSQRQLRKELIHPCSEQHTAADDIRGRNTWKNCYETGLMGMGCRHDHILKYINIIQSGERGHFPVAMMDWLMKQSRRNYKYGVLYDIGCNMERGILIRDLFADERQAGLLKFGTSVFHSFVHQWTCQLQYNPRLNMDWGLLDGEGMERIWSRLSSLISGLRYSTSAHRLCALQLRSQHHNEAGRANLVQWLLKREASARKQLVESKTKLQILACDAVYTEAYLIEQWERQRHCQLTTMVVENTDTLNKKLARLVGLEQSLQQSEEDYETLRAKRRRDRSNAEHLEVAALPAAISVLKAKINEVVDELGGDEYRDIPGATTPKGRGLIRIRVAKTKLHVAKIDVFTMQKHSDQRAGTRFQQKMKKTLREKQAAFKSKYNTFQRLVNNFNKDFPEGPLFDCPSFDDARSLSVYDSFWDVGQLTHPGEAWAVDPKTQDGIHAYLAKTHALDELILSSRLSRS